MPNHSQEVAAQQHQQFWTAFGAHPRAYTSMHLLAEQSAGLKGMATGLPMPVHGHSMSIPQMQHLLELQGHLQGASENSFLLVSS